MLLLSSFFHGLLYANIVKESIEAFFVNNRESSASSVGISIVASCVGGSATIGMAGLAWQVGTPAFWWLGTGAIGLMILTFFLAKTVRETGARTMPEMVTTFIGAPARPVISLIIVLAWLSITAAQFSAMAAIIAPLTGMEFLPSLIIGAVIVVAYAALGGQSVVIKSDVMQHAILMVALAITFGVFFWDRPNAFEAVPFEVLNSDFPFSRFSYFLFILGGSYIICPCSLGVF